MKKIFLILVLVFLVGQTASVSSSIRAGGCEGDEIAAFSMYSKTGGNVAEPGYYKYDVCISEAVSINIKNDCGSNEDSLISMFSRTDSHASTFSTYKWDVCTEQIVSSVKESCGNPIVSVRKKDDTHVAEPGHFKYQICRESSDPENVTVELKGVSGSIYADENSISTGETMTPPVEYPYIVSDQPAGIVSYGEFIELSRPESDKVSLTQETGGSFLLPFTKGGYEEVENQEDEVVSRTFMDNVEPSFGFPIPDEPLSKIRYSFDYSVEGFEERESRNIQLVIRNKFTDSNGTELLIKPK